MNEPVTLNFIFGTIGVILVITGIAILLVNKKAKQRNEFPENIKKEK